MKMDVEDLLSGLFADIELQIIAAAAVFLGELFCDFHQMADDLFVPFSQVGDRRNVLSRTDQEMNAGLGMYVLKRHAHIVLVHNFRRNFLGDDSAKKTRFHDRIIKDCGRSCDTFLLSLPTS